VSLLAVSSPAASAADGVEFCARVKAHGASTAKKPLGDPRVDPRLLVRLLDGIVRSSPSYRSKDVRPFVRCARTS
jgi:hypothetical protein